MHCKCKYTPEPKPRGYPEDLRKQAVQLYVDGMNLRRIGRHLGIHHGTVSSWVQAHAASLPEAPLPEEVKEAEMDELFTFIGNKKTGSTSSPA
jgi:transposase-like protein